MLVRAMLRGIAKLMLADPLLKRRGSIPEHGRASENLRHSDQAERCMRGGEAWGASHNFRFAQTPHSGRENS